MVLDDGGDATKLLHDRHPDLLARSAASLRRRRPGSTGSMR
jgi:S-adenosylhomocysteine hydrolase